MTEDNEGYLPLPKGFSTTAIHAFQDPEQCDSLAVVAPLVTSCSFKICETQQVKKYFYGRGGNPNRDILENCLAKLDNGQYGLCFPAGIAALTAIANLHKSGDHFIVCEEIYHGAVAVLDEISRNFGLEVSYVKSGDIEQAIRPNTKLIWVEAVTNPRMEVIDIRALAEIAHKYGVLLAVDNTFMTPYFLRPLELGADIVNHSLSKYINGHTDVVMGSLITNNQEIYNRLRLLQYTLGIVPAPFDCYQVTRGLKTLSLRMEQHMKSALELAGYLESHRKVEKVLHPGLPSHPQHEVHRKQASGCSGMFSFFLKGGDEAARKFMSSLKIFIVATSLGGPQSLAKAPFLSNKVQQTDNIQDRLGAGSTLIRMSVGLEDTEDLIEDVKQALDSA